MTKLVYNCRVLPVLSLQFYIKGVWKSNWKSLNLQYKVMFTITLTTPKKFTLHYLSSYKLKLHYLYTGRKRNNINK